LRAGSIHSVAAWAIAAVLSGRGLLRLLIVANILIVWVMIIVEIILVIIASA